MGTMNELKRLQAEFEEKLAGAGSPEEIEDVRVSYLGRKGELTGILRSVSDLPAEERPEVGKKANELKNKMTALLEKARARTVDPARGEKTEDVTLPGARPRLGGRHPVSSTMEMIEEAFIALGFGIAEGPEIETEFYNFEALNIPLDHPSRDAFDTFYIEGEHLLRSHTSNVQIHIMQNQPPPLALIMPGRVYRPDTPDASHSFMFHQVEGLMVDEDVTFRDLKGLLDVFCKSLFGRDVKIRFRPHFFPFTEPSAEVDISCIICGGTGCRVCSGNGWLEVLGAGMVDPVVFDKVGYDPERYTGLAFGIGVERIAMLKYGIEDIRLFYENDIRFLEQFK